ncbi:MAG: NINE protein [Spirochaetes bacterium]|jgi:TM2 domain-containing membrane protein YozV|nr:NINE protein [Spirochaetota bacterium]
MYQIGMAYLLWLPSLFGVAGLHRFYIGKIGTGLLYLLTGGLLGLGTLYDAVTLPNQVQEANYRLGYRYGGTRQMPGTDPVSDMFDRISGSVGQQQRRPMSVEQIILTTAREHGGYTTATEIALEAQVSVDEAKEELDGLVSKGIAEVRVKKNGVLAYVFPELLDEATESQFEDL